MTAASKEGRTASIVIIELADRLERRFLFNQNWPFCISAEKRCWPRWQNYWSPSKWGVKLGPAHSINMHCLPGGGPGVKYIQWLLTYSRKPYICLRWECLHRLGWPKRLLMSQLPNWQSVPPTHCCPKYLTFYIIIIREVLILTLPIYICRDEFIDIPWLKGWYWMTWSTEFKFSNTQPAP